MVHVETPPLENLKPKSRAWRALLGKRWPLGVILVVWSGIWWPVILGKSQLYIRDLTFYTLPMKTYMMERFQAGEFPFWTPRLSGGIPFFAEASHQVLYPLNFLFFLTPTVIHGISWFVIVHSLLSMAAFYAFGRTFKLSKGVSLWSALLYGLSGYILSVTDNVNYLPTVVWSPLGLAAFVKGLETGQWRYTALGALCLCLMLMAGDSLNPMFLSAVMVCLGLASLRFPVLDFKPSLRFALAHIAGTIFLSGVLAAVQLLPTLEMAHYSVRQSPLSFEEITLWSFPPQRLVEFVLPFFYGSKYPSPHFIGMFLYPEFREPWADSIYLGVIPLALGILALFAQRGKALFWLGAAVTALAFSFGHFAFYYPALLKLVPMLQYHRYQEKFLFWTTLSLCLMAGLGAQRLLEAKKNPLEGVGWLPKLVIGLGALLTGLLFVVEIPSQLWIWPHAMERSAEWGGHFYDRAVHVAGLRGHWLLLSGILIAVGLNLSALPERFKRHTIHGLLVAALLDLMWVHGNHTPMAPTELLTKRPKPYALERIDKDLARRGLKTSAHGVGPRILYDDANEYPEYPQERRTLDRIAKVLNKPGLEDNFDDYWIYRVLYNQQRMLFNFGAIYNTRYLNGRFSPLQPLNHKRMDDVLLANAPPLLLAFCGTEYVVTPTFPVNPAWNGPSFEELAVDKELNVRVLRFKGAAPRAALYPNALYNMDPNTFRFLSRDFQNFKTQVEISAPGWNGQPEPQALVEAKPGKIEWIEDRPEHLRLVVDSPYPTSHLVINESFFPGWTAEVDRQPASIYLANHRFMGIRVPQGKHEVSLSYKSNHFAFGVGLSLLGLLLAAGLCALDFVKLPAKPAQSKLKPRRGKRK